MRQSTRGPSASRSPLGRGMQKFLADESGPTAVEYAVMLALILVSCVAIVSSLGTRVSTNFSNVISGTSS